MAINLPRKYLAIQWIYRQDIWYDDEFTDSIDCDDIAEDYLP